MEITVVENLAGKKPAGKVLRGKRQAGKGPRGKKSLGKNGGEKTGEKIHSTDLLSLNPDLL